MRLHGGRRHDARFVEIGVHLHEAASRGSGLPVCSSNMSAYMASWSEYL